MIMKKRPEIFGTFFDLIEAFSVLIRLCVGVSIHRHSDRRMAYDILHNFYVANLFTYTRLPTALSGAFKQLWSSLRIMTRLSVYDNKIKVDVNVPTPARKAASGAYHR